MASVRIPTVLRKHTDGQARLQASGDTVREIFSGIVAEHPDLQDKIFDGDQVRGFINVYVEDEDIRYLDGLDSSVEEDDEISIMPAVAGGAEAQPSTPGARRVAGGAEARPSTPGARRVAGG